MKTKEKIKLLTTSTIIYLMSFFVAYTVFQALTLVLAKIFGIGTEFEYYRVEFTTSNYSYLWDSVSIIMIYGVPPLVSFGLAIITQRLHNFARKKRSNMKLLYGWLAINFYTIFLGGIIAGLLTSSGFAYFLNWMYIPFIVQIILALGALAFMFFQRNYLNYALLQTSPSKSYIAKAIQGKYKKYVAYYPFIIGSIILFSIGYPSYSIHDIILRVIPVIAIFGLRKIIDEDDIKLVRNSQVFSPNYGFLILIIAYILIFQFIIK